MAKETTNGKFQFTTHRPTDETDPGFKLIGQKLRWLGARHSERGGDRIWIQLRQSDLPSELMEHLRNRVPQWLIGDTIRKGGEHGSCLGYASLEAVSEHRNYLNAQAKQLDATIHRKPKIAGVQMEYEKTTEKHNVPSKFKKGDE